MRTCLRPRLRCQEKLWFPLQSLGTAPQNCFFVNENGINPSLCIVAPGQHLVFCYLLNLQKSFCKKKRLPEKRQDLVFKMHRFDISCCAT